MKKIYIILVSILLIGALSSCNNQKQNKLPVKVNSDSLVQNIGKYLNTKVQIEGMIAHVCAMHGKKMKLRTNDGGFIKIVTKDSVSGFDKSLNRRRIRVSGTVSENRIDKATLDLYEKRAIQVCSIDNLECKDSSWINSNIKLGIAKKLSKRSVERLRKIMKETGKDYISTVVIIADSVKVLQ